MKLEGANLHIKQLLEWVKEYRNLDELNIGFPTREDYNRHNGSIVEQNESQILNNQKLTVLGRDMSSLMEKKYG